MNTLTHPLSRQELEDALFAVTAKVMRSEGQTYTQEDFEADKVKDGDAYDQILNGIEAIVSHIFLARIAAIDKLPPIEHDDIHKTRAYVPLPGGWEIQTKGTGSTFRILDRNTGNRRPVLDDDLHDVLEKMARDVRGAWLALTGDKDPA